MQIAVRINLRRAAFVGRLLLGETFWIAARRTTTRTSLRIIAPTVALLAQVASAENNQAYDRHVFFETSAADSSYYHSSATAVAPSELEIVNDKLPVDSRHFVSPPNGLRLKWKSAFGG